MKPFNPNYWAVILGGSSGFGLATAHKLSQHGMNIAVVHRDRQGSMARIKSEFDQIIARGVGFQSWNVDALSVEGREEVIKGLKKQLGDQGKVRLLMHSIAFGNLKLFAPILPRTESPVDKLAQALGVENEKVRTIVKQLFSEGDPSFVQLAGETPYNNENLLEDEDWAHTIYAMGSSLVSWVRSLLDQKLFCEDARVLGMTSEGNQIALRGYGAVSAAKVVLESAARTIALECAPYGIRANIIQAGVTPSPALNMIPGHEQMLAKAKLKNPFRRLTRAEDVSNFICLMCTDEASWVNGGIIRVDGGEQIGS